MKSTNDIVTPNRDCRRALDCSDHREQVIMSKTVFEMAKTQRLATASTNIAGEVDAIPGLLGVLLRLIK